MFREEDHPRGQPDNAGKFVEKGKSSSYSSQEDPAQTLSKRVKKAKVSKPSKAYGFADKKRKNSPDHLRHAKEMGYKNQDQYESAAIDFWDNGEGEVFYGNKRNRFAKYNSKTREYVVVEVDGTLRTYYKVSFKKFQNIKKQEEFSRWEK